MFELARGVDKTRYEAHFVSKLTDADSDNAETQTWLDFGCDSEYISRADHIESIESSHEIGPMLGRIINDPTSFIQRQAVRPPKSDF